MTISIDKRTKILLCFYLDFCAYVNAVVLLLKEISFDGFSVLVAGIFEKEAG